MIDIDKAFEGRWRIKSAGSHLMALDVELFEEIKSLCRDFFETGICLGEGFNIAYEYDEKGEPTGQQTVYKRDPILDTADSGFSEWWDLYGKKIDRAKCEKKWAKLTPSEKQACIDATPAYVASTPDLQFRRHPMTYLNNKSWENQIIPRNNGTNQPSKQQQDLNKLASILTD